MFNFGSPARAPVSHFFDGRSVGEVIIFELCTAPVRRHSTAYSSGTRETQKSAPNHNGSRTIFCSLRCRKKMTTKCSMSHGRHSPNIECDCGTHAEYAGARLSPQLTKGSSQNSQMILSPDDSLS